MLRKGQLLERSCSVHVRRILRGRVDETTKKSPVGERTGKFLRSRLSTASPPKRQMRLSLAMARVLLLLIVLAPQMVHSFAVRKAPKKSAKKKTAAAAASGGFGKAVAVAAGPTPAQLLMRSMEAFEELERRRAQINAADGESISDDGAVGEGEPPLGEASSDAVAGSVTKYVVALRTTARSCAEFSDWVPVAIVAIGCGDAAAPDSLVPSAVGAHVKEVIEGASQSISVLRKVARETLEYAYEPLDSFESHVYEGLQGRTERRGDAYKTLGIEPGASAGEVKKAHRKLMMELHPDRAPSRPSLLAAHHAELPGTRSFRHMPTHLLAYASLHAQPHLLAPCRAFCESAGFVGDEEGAATAQAQMLEVQEAYGELGGGQGASISGSFYESIGGKARTDFSGALAKERLAPLGKRRPEMEVPIEDGGWSAGVVPMTQSISQEFVTRNLMRRDA